MRRQHILSTADDEKCRVNTRGVVWHCRLGYGESHEVSDAGQEKAAPMGRLVRRWTCLTAGKSLLYNRVYENAVQRSGIDER